MPIALFINKDMTVKVKEIWEMYAMNDFMQLSNKHSLCSTLVIILYSLCSNDSINTSIAYSKNPSTSNRKKQNSNEVWEKHVNASLSNAFPCLINALALDFPSLQALRSLSLCLKWYTTAFEL